MTTKLNKSVLPAVGIGVAAVAAVSAVMMKPKKKATVQSAAGKALKAMGEVVENFSGSMKM